eukprot:3651259-Prorocentrum_lima.AAC.1
MPTISIITIVLGTAGGGSAGGHQQGGRNRQRLERGQGPAGVTASWQGAVSPRGLILQGGVERPATPSER